jgi:5'-nucleotidase
MGKRVLITNDDGYESKGLYALIEAVEGLAEVVVVAPTVEKSACGHSLTLTRPLRFIEVKENFYKLDDGTPSDCVFLSLAKIFKDKKPDLVLSGINIGANMGEDITYSGTAAGAMEAVLQGIPAISISQVCRSNCRDVFDLEFKLAKKVVRDLVKTIFEKGYPLDDRRFLNINIPPVEPNECNGIKITHAGRRAYGNDADVYINPRGQEYYWIGLPKLEWHHSKSPLSNFSDFEAIRDNFVSITPIHLDMTHYESIKRVENWIDI